MARATLQAKKEAQALKAEFLAEREARRESLERRLFGLAGTPSATELMVMRDLAGPGSLGDIRRGCTAETQAGQPGWRYVHGEGDRTGLLLLKDGPKLLRPTPRQRRSAHGPCWSSWRIYPAAA